MKLSVSSFTMQESAGQVGTFPKAIKQKICNAIEAISIDEMSKLMAEHESSAENFDGQVERNLRVQAPQMSIEANRRILPRTKFDNDLVIEAGGNVVCVEIEKGTMSRFEFDILKMQALAHQCRKKATRAKVYGAFIVPMDNLVARHISGRKDESSYAYLKRLSRLVGATDQGLLADILVVGYSTTAPIQKSRKSRSVATDNIVIASKGVLLPDEVIANALRGCPVDVVRRLRKELLAACPSLREKLNRNSRYLGYAMGNRSDALYVYVQKKRLLLDIRIPKEREEELRQQGFQIRPRDNYQSKSGWLTGLVVPADMADLSKVTDLALEAVQG